nr:MAG TPA_asm: hypothetical protein [Bacteriophage sp.]
MHNSYNDTYSAAGRGRQVWPVARKNDSARSKNASCGSGWWT